MLSLLFLLRFAALTAKRIMTIYFTQFFVDGQLIMYRILEWIDKIYLHSYVQSREQKAFSNITNFLLIYVNYDHSKPIN